jgi:hypothetical protein
MGLTWSLKGMKSPVYAKHVAQCMQVLVFSAQILWNESCSLSCYKKSALDAMLNLCLST